uniref:Telomeric repeat-binding factor n=1 Tax=Malurus cyaneus samueli TaxID=2593467 RepID=A0A8C5T2L0_9PASS
MAAAGECSSFVSSSVILAPPAAAEAVATEWVLEFVCSCLCRHFSEESGAGFERWSDVAQALINGLSQIPPHQKKTVYLCQILIRIAQGTNLGLHFDNDHRISPLESALSFWTLLEREEIKLEKLHEDIHRLIQIQCVAVYMESRYFKEAAEALERLFTDSESDKPLRVKLATIIKSKDPYVPFLQSFSYSLLISKIKTYIELFVKRNGINFLIQEAAKQVESKGLGAVAMPNKFVEVSENYESDSETEQGFVLSIILLRDVRWTEAEDMELRLGVREFGVGNWAKILVHGNFNNRTSVMLKDRWRTLSKIEQG